MKMPKNILKYLRFLTKDEIEAIVEQHKEAPHLRSLTKAFG